MQRDEIHKPEPVKEKPAKDKKSATEVVAPTRNKKEKLNKQALTNPVAPINSVIDKEVKDVKIIEEKVVEKEVVETVAIVPPTNGVIIGNPGKEKKKKKSEFSTRQQLSKL